MPNLKSERRLGESILQFLERQTKSQIELVLGTQIENVPDIQPKQISKTKPKTCSK